MPKLALGGATACHLMLFARPHLGSGSDAPDFKPLVGEACRRAPVKIAVADSGYDWEENHCYARGDLGVRSIIPPRVGRPTSGSPSGYWRRHMRHRFARRADRRLYGQSAQVETIISMIKRNRSRVRRRQKAEMMLRAVVHNIILIGRLDAG